MPLSLRRASALLVLAGATAVGPAVSPLAPVTLPAAQAAQATRHVDYRAWDTQRALAGGTTAGTVASGGTLSIGEPVGVRRYAGQRYDLGRWTSRWTRPGFGLSELVASWSATTPGDSWLEVQVRGRDADGAVSDWDVLGRWAAEDAGIARTSVPDQGDGPASVAVDTWRVTAAAGLPAYQLRVVLLRPHGATDGGPVLDQVGAMASRLPDAVPPTSTPSDAIGPDGTVLAVPRWSQMVHEGDYPQWGGGGEAWCSPTSVSMLLGYYDALPDAAAYDWVPDGHPAPWVDYAARQTYDHDYDGTGNWPFNTAYAAPLAGHAFVTRLRDLTEAERFIAAGIPLAASIAFSSGQLDGAPISSTAGHLLVIRGFTADGDVVVNDPAASSRRGVRRTYDRAQFERAWLGGSGGLVYVVRDDAHPLPTPSSGTW